MRDFLGVCSVVVDVLLGEDGVWRVVDDSSCSFVSFALSGSSERASIACIAGTKQCFAYSCSERKVLDPGLEEFASPVFVVSSLSPPSSFDSVLSSLSSSSSTISSGYILGESVIHCTCDIERMGANVVVFPPPPPASSIAVLTNARAPILFPSNDSVDATAMSPSSSLSSS